MYVVCGFLTFIGNIQEIVAKKQHYKLVFEFIRDNKSLIPYLRNLQGFTPEMNMKFCAQDLADEIPVDITREVNQLYTVSNRLFSSKCGIKDIDLDKNESIFIQM